MKRSLLHLLLWVSIGVLAYSIGRGADYIIEAYNFLAIHYILSIIIISLLAFLIVVIKLGWVSKLIKKYRTRNDIYLNIDDSHYL